MRTLQSNWFPWVQNIMPSGLSTELMLPTGRRNLFDPNMGSLQDQSVAQVTG